MQETGDAESLDDDIDLSNLQVNTLDEAFSFSEGLYRLNQMKDALTSFRELTNASKGKLSKEDVKTVGNTDWEIQTLGFHNWPMTVEGTLRKQEYQIKQLELRLAEIEHENGNVTDEDLKNKRTEYEKAKTELQQFIDSFTVAD